MLGSLLLLAAPALAPAQEQVPPPAKLTGSLEVSRKYVLPGQKVRLTAILSAPAPAGTQDLCTIRFEGKEEDPKNFPIAEGAIQVTEAEGKQRRAWDWPVPADFGSGRARVSWRSGDLQMDASIIVCKRLEEVDWAKATVEEMRGTAVLMETNLGEMTVEFFPDKAPETVRHFLGLVSRGFYDQVIFHRVAREHWIQGGDPTGTGKGDPGFRVRAEFNDIEHRRGVLSMARSSRDKDSAACQFFIIQADHLPDLDGKYTAFGKVMDGFETLARLASVKVTRQPFGKGEATRPVEKIFKRKVTVIKKP